MFWNIVTVSVFVIGVIVHVSGAPTNGQSLINSGTETRKPNAVKFLKPVTVPKDGKNGTNNENSNLHGKHSFPDFFTPSLLLICLGVLIFVMALVIYCAVLRSWESKRLLSIKRDRSRSLLLDAEYDRRVEDGDNDVELSENPARNVPSPPYYRF